MSVSYDYRMRPEECPLFKEKPKLALAVLDRYVNYEKKCAKARKELNAELKDLFAPFEPKEM